MQVETNGEFWNFLRRQSYFVTTGPEKQHDGREFYVSLPIIKKVIQYFMIPEVEREAIPRIIYSFMVLPKFPQCNPENSAPLESWGTGGNWREVI